MKSSPAEQRLDRPGNAFGLGVFIRHFKNTDGLDADNIRIEPRPMVVAARYDLMRRAKNGLGRTVVARKRGNTGARIVAKKFAEISRIGAAEAVDGLIRIANDT
jgi:hypothetical protein